MGGAGRAQRGRGGLDARGRALAPARRSARPRRGREGRLVRDGLSRARGPSACGRRNFSPASSSRISPPRSGAISPSSMRAAPPIPSIPAAFANDDTFEAIRIEPYLRATGRAHPELASRFDALARTTLATKRALVHGDVSPKNILQGAARAGVPRRRMRLVRRSRLRSCVLSQSSPAEGRARGRRPGALSTPPFRRWQAPISPASTGRAPTASKRARPRCCRRCSSPGSTASRRSSTSPARASARPCAAAPRR